MSLSNNISAKKTNKNSDQKRQAAALMIGESTKRVSQKAAKRAARPIRTYFDSLNKFEASTRPFYPDTHEGDGINHINIYSDARTDLGAALSMDYELKFKIGELGEFGSLTAFHFFVTRPVIDDSLRMMSPKDIRAKMRAIRQGGEPVVNPVNYRFLMLNAIGARIMQYSGLRQLLIDSKMRFECYFPPSKNQPSYRQPMAAWLIPGMEIIRNGIRLDNAGEGILSDFLDDAEVNEQEVLLARPVYQEPVRTEKSVLDKLLIGEPEPKAKKRKKKKGVDLSTVPGLTEALKAVPKDKAPKWTIADSVNELKEDLEKLFALSCYAAFKTRKEAFAFMVASTRSKEVLAVNCGGIIISDDVSSAVLGEHPFIVTVFDEIGDGSRRLARMGDFSDANPYDHVTPDVAGEISFSEDAGHGVTTDGSVYKLSEGRIRSPRETVQLVDHADQPLEVPTEELSRAQDLAEDQPTQA